MKPTSSAKAAKPGGSAKSEMRDFADNGKRGPMMSDLYRRAEAEQRKLKKLQKSKAADAGPEADPQRLLHELQVHQIELQMQNAELQHARDELETSLEKYTDLYDFAPVGYFTLAPDGIVHLVNLTGAHLVGIERSRLVGLSFGLLVPAELRPVFNAFLKRVFADPARQTGDFEVLIKGRSPRAVNIEAQRSPNGHGCRMAVVDITERKQAEEKVRVSEVRYRRLFEAAHDGVLILDPGTRKITDANPFMTKLLGYSRAQLAGKELFEIGLLKDEAASREMFQKLKRSHEVRYEDLPLESQDGRHQEVEVVANLYQEDGRPVIKCNIRDITERKAAADALGASEERYRNLFNSMDEGYCVIEMIFDKRLQAVDYRFVEVNRAFEKQSGLHDVVGKRMLELVPAVGENWLANYGKVALTGEPIRFANEYKELNRWFDVYAFRIGGNESRKVAVLFNNITERKQAEAALRQSEDRYRTLFTSIDEGFCVVEMIFDKRKRPVDYRFLEVNPTFEKQTGLVNAVGKRMRDLVPDIESHWIEIYGQVALTGGSIRFMNEAKAMGGRWFDAYACRVGGAESRKVAIVFNDITKRKHAEATLRRVAVLAASNQKLENEITRRRVIETNLKQSEQQQRVLLSESRTMQERLRQLSREILRAQEDERKRISRELHDVIAQTLTGITVQLAALKKDASLKVPGIDRNILRTQRLVEKSVNVVHEFARELRPAVLDDLGLIPALHSFVKHFSKRTHINVHLKVFAGIEQMDNAKRTVLYRVAQEALGNVARHAKAGRVEVNIEKLDRSARMEIKDDGKSFDVVRALKARGNKRLGLLGMRERVDMVGGTFGVESAPGQGTIVRVEIPFIRPVGKSARKKPGQTKIKRA